MDRRDLGEQTGVRVGIGAERLEASTIWRESRNGYFAFGRKVEMAILLLAGK
jgi:hypothetical protein